MPHRQLDEHTRAALAMCENIDWNVGRVLKLLDRLELAENTIVMYFSDNGPNGDRWNGGMRGRKGHVDDGGVRSPLVARWPKGIKAGHVVKPLTSVMDLLPTLLELTGVKRTGDKPFDGRSFVPLLKGDVPSWPDRMVVSHWGRGKSVRSDRFRLTRGRLYDMQADMGQTKDVAAKHPETAEKMGKALATYAGTIALTKPTSGSPFYLTHPTMSVTQMPMRDAIAGGKIKRSSKHPNSSYFLNWVDMADSITWNVTAEESGTYAVEMFYATPPADVGAKLELRFKGEVLPFTIKKGHDAVLLGAGMYRSTRGEGQEKDFMRVTMGKMKVVKGAGVLELAAVEMPGASVAEVRLLIFRRME